MTVAEHMVPLLAIAAVGARHIEVEQGGFDGEKERAALLGPLWWHVVQEGVRLRRARRAYDAAYAAEYGDTGSHARAMAAADGAFYHAKGE